MNNIISTRLRNAVGWIMFRLQFCKQDRKVKVLDEFRNVVKSWWSKNRPPLKAFAGKCSKQWNIFQNLKNVGKSDNEVNCLTELKVDLVKVMNWSSIKEREVHAVFKYFSSSQKASLQFGWTRIASFKETLSRTEPAYVSVVGSR